MTSTALLQNLHAKATHDINVRLPWPALPCFKICTRKQNTIYVHLPWPARPCFKSARESNTRYERAFTMTSTALLQICTRKQHTIWTCVYHDQHGLASNLHAKATHDMNVRLPWPARLGSNLHAKATHDMNVRLPWPARLGSNLHAKATHDMNVY